jgi:predicted O-linked N-acetylglucosamine transferase (SPINDLY family)
MLIKLMRAVVSRFSRRTSAKSAPPAIDGESIRNDLLSAVAMHRGGNLMGAVSIYESILVRHPDTADAQHLLSIVEHRRGNLDRAEELVSKAIALNPRSVEYLNTRASILADLGKAELAINLLKKALGIDSHALRPRSNLLFMLNLLPGADRQEVYDEHLRWAEIHAPSQKERFVVIPKALGERKLRIGYVSGDFRAHPVGRIMSAVLSRHDRSAIEVFCYDNTRETDSLNRSMRMHSDRWTPIVELSDEQVTELIRRDEIDVLIDLSGHTHGNRLLVFAKRPAPVQASWLGYLNTTGMSQIDWRITCPATDPEPVASAYHSERIWSLPDCLWPWIPEDYPSDESVNSSPFQSNNIIFGSFNTFRKISPEVISVWAGILRRVPTSILRIHGVPRGRTVDDLLDLFKEHGADPQRIDFFGVLDHAKYQQAYAQVHIALDSFPYSGGATTCECLWMGVPVIALGGSGGFARTAAGILTVVGLQELIATTQEDYIERAVDLAQNISRLHEYRNTIRKRFEESSIMDVPRFVGHLEAAYRSMWEDRILRAQVDLPVGGIATQVLS